MNNNQLIQYAELWAADPGEKMWITNWEKQLRSITMEAFDFEKEKPREGMKFINDFITMLTGFILRLSAAVEPPYAPPPPVLPDGFSSNEEYIQARQSYYRHMLDIYKKAEDRLKAELIEQMLDNRDLVLIDQYFSDRLSMVQFHEVLDSLSLLEGGKLKDRQTGKLIEVFRAAITKGLTKKEVYSESKLRKIIFKVSAAYGMEISDDNVYRILNKPRAMETYKQALEEFSNISPD